MSRRVEIILRENKQALVRNLLVDYFSAGVSPDLPYFVWFDAPSRPSNDPGWVIVDFRNFRIVKKLPEEDTPYPELAKIIPQSYPPKSVIFITETEGCENWEAVENIARKIIDKMLQLGIEIETVNPSDFYPNIPKNQSTARMPRTRKPGRPHHSDDDWAWEQVNELGRPVSEVKAEWEKRPGVVARDLLNPDKAFRKATNRPALDNSNTDTK